MAILGIDTSCYTTSLALVDNGQLVGQRRKLLKVDSGQRGLQQSAAVFQHLQNLPELAEEIFLEYKTIGIDAVCASTRPRPLIDSYMPVFTVSKSLGRSLAAALGVPFLETSHQEGHIMAGIWSGDGPQESDFLAVHLSGGTTEILKVSKDNQGADTFKIDLLGGSADLHAGQFVDRVGVALGLDFPAGPALEELARQSTGEVKISSAVKDYQISFSGPETAAERLIRGNCPPPDVARAVEHCIASSLEKVLRRAVKEKGLKSVLIVGGVAANGYIKARLKERLEHPAVGAKLYFAETQLSSDNAVGVALIGELKKGAITKRTE